MPSLCHIPRTRGRRSCDRSRRCCGRGQGVSMWTDQSADNALEVGSRGPSWNGTPAAVGARGHTYLARKNLHFCGGVEDQEARTAAARSHLRSVQGRKRGGARFLSPRESALDTDASVRQGRKTFAPAILRLSSANSLRAASRSCSAASHRCFRRALSFRASATWRSRSFTARQLGGKSSCTVPPLTRSHRAYPRKRARCQNETTMSEAETSSP